jgi:thiamine thiazole synthase
MDAAASEAFVVERVAEAYPGLWATGMAVCATFGGPRIGPIFGGECCHPVRELPN